MTPHGFLFELSGGALCLDFANTGESPVGLGPAELLRRYGDLLAWGEQAGVITADEARALEKSAARSPNEAEAAIERARNLREALFSVFASRAAGAGLPAKPMEVLGPEITAALAHRRLSTDGTPTKAAWMWTDELALDRVLWPVLGSAGELLTSDELGRVRECASEACSWLFLDRSKNGSRRWCDMTVCGNRDKVRRHRRRQREG